MKKIVKVFELPHKLGLLQEIEFSYNEYSKYEGLLTAVGCRRGICIKYRVFMRSKNGVDWEAKPRRRESDLGGCLRQPVADALWELAGKYEVEVWYEYKTLCSTCPGIWTMDCGLSINGIRLRPPYCHTVNECIEQILKDYRRAVEALKEPPMRSRDHEAEEFLRHYPELAVFGLGWVKEWLPYAKDRMIQLAKILQTYKKAKTVIERAVIKENPYAVEIYVSTDGEEECVAVGTEVYCLSSDKIRKVPIDYIGLLKRGLMAYVKRKEFTRVA